MQPPGPIQERVRFGEGGRLAGVLHYPETANPRQAVLLCSPHPNFAGDMDNNVIQSLAEHVGGSRVVLRFDYRGVAESRIVLPPGLSVLDFWDQVEQKRDYTDALADTADAADELWRVAGGLPMVAIGYSFGAATATIAALADGRFCAMAGIAPPFKRISFDFLGACPKPCLLLSGKNDFVYEPEIAAKLSRAGGELLNIEIREGADHFFRGLEHELGQRMAAFMNELGRIPAAQCGESALRRSD